MPKAITNMPPANHIAPSLQPQLAYLPIAKTIIKIIPIIINVRTALFILIALNKSDKKCCFLQICNPVKIAIAQLFIASVNSCQPGYIR
jgi:hypothetical protein